MAKLIKVCGIAVLSCSLWAQLPSQPPSESELAEITARGHALAGYDAAAWHATDAVVPLKPDKSAVQRYIARKTNTGWVVAWGHFNEAKTKFLIVYKAQQKGDSNDYTVNTHDPPLEDSDIYLHAAKAHELVIADFFRDGNPGRPYNISILPAGNRQWYVYAIPAQTDLAVLPYGGDIRYLVSTDGTQILEKRQMHKIVIEENIGPPPEFDFHTHVLSDLPEDSDVFYALTRKAVHGEWICTKQYVYEVSPLGSLNYLGTTPNMVKLLRDGKALPELDATDRAMALSSAQRVLEGKFSGHPLEVFTSFAGARCAKTTLWLKFAITLHNVGERKVILYKEPLRNSQARFGASAADILSEKYEKLAFFSPEKVDLSADDTFMGLSPGMMYRRDAEYPMLGIDMHGKSAVQFLFFTWPLGEEREVDAQRSRWMKTGDLYADTIAADPVLLNIDPELLKSCPAQK